LAKCFQVKLRNYVTSLKK